MKRGIFFVFLLLGLNLVAQQTVEISGKLDDCGNQVGLFEFKALGLIEVAKSAPSEDGSFTVELATDQPRMLYIGQAPNKVAPILIKPDNKVEVTGSCRNPKLVKVAGSPLNGNYQVLRKKINEFKRQNNQLMGKMVKAETEEEKSAAILELKSLDEKRIFMLDSLHKEEPYLGKILALNTYLSYPNNQGDYENELEYFGNEFFRHVDFSDPTYMKLPLIFDAFFDYTRTLSSIRIPSDLLQRFLDLQLSKTVQYPGVHQLALGGTIRALERNKHELFGTYGEQFVQQYQSEFPKMAADIQKRIAVLTQFNIGKVAPDFVQNTPDGKEMRLSDFKGKYVLIDFWASWCGPCRRENPNVVRLYNQYKDKGFDILGVSLDRDKGRWLKAIEQDGLEWSHVSDLKGWGNAVAKQYNISSIPRTILLDPEGKIIGKNLRGPSLESKLIEIFGASSGQ